MNSKRVECKITRDILKTKSDLKQTKSDLIWNNSELVFRESDVVKIQAQWLVKLGDFIHNPCQQDTSDEDSLINFMKNQEINFLIPIKKYMEHS